MFGEAFGEAVPGGLDRFGDVYFSDEALTLGAVRGESRDFTKDEFEKPVEGPAFVFEPAWGHDWDERWRVEYLGVRKRLSEGSLGAELHRGVLDQDHGLRIQTNLIEQAFRLNRVGTAVC